MKKQWTITDENWLKVVAELRSKVDKELEMYKANNDMKHYDQALAKAYGLEETFSAIIRAAKFEVNFDEEEQA